MSENAVREVALAQYKGAVPGEAVVVCPKPALRESGQPLTSIRGSLGVSVYSMAFGQELLLHVAELARWRSDAERTSPAWKWVGHTGELLDALAAVPPPETVEDTWTKEKLERTLAYAFDEEYLESGVGHPAEDILSMVLSWDGSATVLNWLTDLCSNDDEPVLAASTLRCLGRLNDPGNLEWRRNLVSVGLSSGDLEVRDAAAQACEEWGETGLLDLLREHSEEVPWLRAYIDGVIKDIET